MSEFEAINWTPNNPNDEPVARLELPDGEEYLATRFNSHLVRHMGNLALYDYIRCLDEPHNFLIFKFVSGHDILAQFMEEQGYPITDNLTRVEPNVIESYYNALEAVAKADDFIPDEWGTSQE